MHVQSLQDLPHIFRKLLLLLFAFHISDILYFGSYADSNTLASDYPNLSYLVNLILINVKGIKLSFCILPHLH